MPAASGGGHRLFRRSDPLQAACCIRLWRVAFFGISSPAGTADTRCVFLRARVCTKTLFPGATPGTPGGVRLYALAPLSAIFSPLYTIGLPPAFSACGSRFPGQFGGADLPWAPCPYVARLPGASVPAFVRQKAGSGGKSTVDNPWGTGYNKKRFYGVSRIGDTKKARGATKVYA